MLVNIHVVSRPDVCANVPILLSIALTLVWVSNITQGPPVGRSAAIAIVNGFSNPANMYIPLP